jgi:dipeptidyl aminopeptidase/acylaminoacyl peptidase
MTIIKKISAFLIFIVLGLCVKWFLFNPSAQTPLIPRSVIFGNAEKVRPQISPDGKRLAYLAPVDGVLNIWVKTIGKNDAQAVSHNTNNGISLWCELWWSHNNKHILFWHDQNGDQNYHIFRLDPTTQELKDLTPFKNVRIYLYASSKQYPNELLIGMNKENERLFDAYRLNIETGALTLVEKNPGTIEYWMPDNNLNIRAARAINEDGSITLLTRDVPTDNWKATITWKLKDGLKVDCLGFTKDAGFSPDNKKLYLHDARNTNTAKFIAYDIATCTETELAHDPLFDAEQLLCNSDNKPVAVCINKERLQWTALDPAFEPHLQKMLSLDTGDLTFCNQSNDNQYWVLRFQHDNRTTNYYLYNTKTQKADFLFDQQPALNKYTLAKTTPITCTSRDGLLLHGYITYPPGKQRKNLPLVVRVHGGPWFRDSWRNTSDIQWGEVQWLANRGYACLQINFRGSAGYGTNFLNAGDHEWGHKMHDDLIDGINWVIDQGIANPKKIAIMGTSYGGYAALVGATTTPDIFCCAVSFCGPCNLVTVLKAYSPYRINLIKQFHMRVGNPNKDMDLLNACSPIYKIDNIKHPIFIEQGANDVLVTKAEAEQIVTALQTKGLAYEYLLFPDEGHDIEKPKNRLRCYAAVEKFLAKYLGGRCEN